MNVQRDRTQMPIPEAQTEGLHWQAKCIELTEPA